MVDQMLYLSSYEECAKYHAMAIGLCHYLVALDRWYHSIYWDLAGNEEW